MRRRVPPAIALSFLGLAVLVVAAGSASAQGRTDQNHFRCYIVSQQTPQPPVAITLDDQFTTAAEPVTVGEPVMICPPTEKTVGD